MGHLNRLVCALCIAAAPSLAQATELDTLRSRVARLESAVAELSQQVKGIEQRMAAEAVAPPAASAAGWKDPNSWAQLRKGMSRFQVMQVLGEPGKVSSYPGFERWEYPDALGGRVNFDDRGRLVGFRKPAPGS